jgi:hypothetical protein
MTRARPFTQHRKLRIDEEQVGTPPRKIQHTRRRATRFAGFSGSTEEKASQPFTRGGV